jgi:anti-anti-sigma regulatory factor
MAKYRHRTFEMYDFRDEAIDALTPKSDRFEKDASDPDPWNFHQLDVSLRKNVTLVQFRGTEYSEAAAENDLRDDFSELAKKLVNDSKVVLDFTGVESFNSACINALVLLNQKLQAKGSRMVLCCVGPGPRESFFAPAERKR